MPRHSENELQNPEKAKSPHRRDFCGKVSHVILKTAQKPQNPHQQGVSGVFEAFLPLYCNIGFLVLFSDKKKAEKNKCFSLVILAEEQRRRTKEREPAATVYQFLPYLQSEAAGSRSTLTRGSASLRTAGLRPACYKVFLILSPRSLFDANNNR